ncbi:MAG: NTP transferase domain-containing protein [Weeksellaceae bacterium]|nr:NTP transferase domain-containing protein [Weeksellaceae bacterium]
MIFNENIFILSGRKGSGKTTSLLRWAEKSINITGFLSPKIDGKRSFQNLKTWELRPMENKNSTLKVGKYVFDEETFSWAAEELYLQFQGDTEWLVIDEIGPLEVRKQQGFHEFLLKILHENGPLKPKLLFVVRDTLVDEFLDHYKITSCKILPLDFFKNNRSVPLKGLVLCGGESTRMKRDKALLQYDHAIQWKKVREMLCLFCDEVVVSVNEDQYKTWVKNEEGIFVVDKADFKDNGPLTGLLSVMESDPETGYFVAAIDYPLLKTEHLIKLFNARREEHEAICYVKNDRTEPLISIFEKEAVGKLQGYFAEGGNSVSRFLIGIKTEKIEAENADFLLNVNSSEEFHNFSPLFNKR